MKKFKLYNELWQYEIILNENNIVIETNCYINERAHWSIGYSFDNLKQYYSRIVKENHTIIDTLTEVKFFELEIN